MHQAGEGSALQAVGTAAEVLLGSERTGEAIESMLPAIGEATGVHRVHVYENRYEGDEVYSTLTYEWVSQGTSRVKGHPGETDFAMVAGGFQRWIDQMESGKLLAVSPSDGSDDERQVLLSENVVSLLCAPIFVDERWWGWIDFDDCENDRAWTDVEMDALRTVARLLGTSLARERMVAKHSEAESKYRTLVEQLPAIVYIADASPENKTLYISPQVKDVYGWAPSEWLTVRGLWEQAIDPEDHDWVLAEAVRTATEGTPFKVEYRAKSRYGKQLWMHEEASLVRDEFGKPRFWQGVILDVTEQKLAAEALEESQVRYQALIEQLPAVIYTELVEGMNNALTYISPRAEELFGYPAKDWVEVPDLWETHIHPDDRERVIGLHQETSRTQKPFRAEYRFDAADGRELWLHDEATLVTDPDGDPYCWQGFMLDITELKQAESRVSSAEERYRNLVERMPSITYIEGITQGTGPLTYISPQIESILGYTAEEWTTNPVGWRAYMHEDDIPRVSALYDAVSAEGRSSMVVDYRMRAEDGRWVWFRDESVQVVDLTGAPQFWQGVMHDITSQKEAEDRVKEAEQRYRILVEQLPTAVYIDALDGIAKSVYMSPQIEQISGYAPEEWVADEDMWRKVLHEEDRAEAVKKDLGVGDSGDPFNHDYRLVRKDGSVVWIHDEATLIRDETGTPMYWQGVMMDVTEQRRSEQLETELQSERQTAQRLREIDEMKNTFLTAVSHDLRTPLAAILGLALTLERGDLGLVVGDGVDLVTRIAANARKLDRLVSDLLDLDRLTRGILEPNRHATDVGAVVRRVLSEADFLDGYAVHVEADPTVLSVDGSKVERIVENLLSNTARHTPAGTQVWVSVHAHEDGALISVEDSGPGVPEDMQGSLFEPFAQGSAGDQARYAPGVGIGLSLVARFTELHGGRAWVEEREGGGAAFHVYLPGEEPALS